MPTSPPISRTAVTAPPTTRTSSYPRWLDAIPGALAWGALLIVVGGAVAAPVTLLTGVALLAVYSALRLAFAAAAITRGLHLIHRWNRIKWHEEYARRRTPDSLPLEAVHHLVILPNHCEPLPVLARTLDRLAEQPNAQAQITVVLAMEASDPDAHTKAAQLQTVYTARFAHLWVTFHPAGLPGEIACKSANLAWALHHARHRLVDELGYDADHVVVTTMDADTLWHPNYFESLGVLFATHPARYRTYWQAPLRYHANVWQSHPLLRILHGYASAWELAYLAAPWWRALPMSSFSLSLHLLDAVGGWDTTTIADEWHLFITTFFAHHGAQDVQPVYLPFMVQAVTGDNALLALRARYRQTFRHAWGAKEIGYTLAQTRQHPETPRVKALGLLLRVAHDNLLAGAGWIVLFFGPQLALLLHSDSLRAHLDSPPVLLLQGAVLVVTALTVAFWGLDLRLRPLRPAPWTPRERLLELASLPLIAVLTVIGVALPVLHAQTCLMRGKTIAFRVTPKS